MIINGLFPHPSPIPRQHCSTTVLMITLHDIRWFGFSTNLTEDGNQVIVTKNINVDDTAGRYLDFWTKYFYMCIDWNLSRTTANGVIMIYDMALTNKNVLLTEVTPSFLRKSLHCSVSDRRQLMRYERSSGKNRSPTVQQKPMTYPPINRLISQNTKTNEQTLFEHDFWRDLKLVSKFHQL